MGMCFAIKKIRWFEYVFTKTKENNGYDVPVHISSN